MEKLKKTFLFLFGIAWRIAIWAAIVAAATFLTIKSGVDVECP